MSEDWKPPSSPISDEEKKEDKPIETPPELELEEGPEEEYVDFEDEEVVEEPTLNASWVKRPNARRTGLTAKQQALFDRIDTINAVKAKRLQVSEKELVELEHMGRLRRV